MKPQRTGLAHVVVATGYSLRGLRFAWRNEAAFRQEVVLALVLLPAAFWLGESATQIAVLVASLFVVVIVELLNTAIEAVVDRIGSEHNHLAGSAKDLGSAAVLASLAMVVFVWGVALWQRFAVP